MRDGFSLWFALMVNPKRKVVLKKGKYIHFFRRDEWEYIERCNCTGIVIILAVNDDGKVILTEQFRIPVNRNVIEFPAGLVNDRKKKKTESVVAAAKRELFEETGYQARRMRVLVKGPGSSGSSSDVMTFVRAEDIRKVGEGGGDLTETIKVHEVFIHEIDFWLQKQSRRGFFIDPKIYAGLYFLKNCHKSHK